MVDMFWSSSCGKIELEFKDPEQVFNMSHSGDCGDSIRAELPYFLEALQKYEIELIAAVLAECSGDWHKDELLKESTEDLYVKLLWIAAWDKHDEINMDELCEWQNNFLAEKRREQSDN